MENAPEVVFQRNSLILIRVLYERRFFCIIVALEVFRVAEVRKIEDTVRLLLARVETLAVPYLVCRTFNVLHVAAWIQFFHHDVQRQPDFIVVAFLERIELAIVGPAFSVDLGVFVVLKSASHGPLTVHKPAVAYLEKLRSATTRTPENAIVDVLLQLKYLVPTVDDDELIIGGTVVQSF